MTAKRALMTKPARSRTNALRRVFSLRDIRWRPSMGYSVFVGVLTFVTLTRMTSNAPSEFIYFKF